MSVVGWKKSQMVKLLVGKCPVYSSAFCRIFAREINHAASKVSASSTLFPNMLHASLVTQVIRLIQCPKSNFSFFSA